MSEEQFEINLDDDRAGQSSEIVVRSSVDSGLPYKDYRKFLRRDFFYSCAYCTVTEFEAGGIRFTIDHYEPVSARPDLQDQYDNLLYACDECNMRKGDIVPPEAARKDGYRFFRPDADIRSIHINVEGVRVGHLSKVGEFTIDNLDLNRQSLRRIRDLRRRLHDCDRHVNEGVFALRSIRIDKLPSQIRTKALGAIDSMAKLVDETSISVDEFLMQAARSPMLDEDSEVLVRRADAAHKLREAQALYPGKWRGRKPRSGPRAK